MNPRRKKIWCCKCDKDVRARLTSGQEIYPHRRDLYQLPFWKFDVCGNFVGCHHKTKNRTRPLGCIPTHGIKEARKKIHAVLDPIWRNKIIGRGELYRLIKTKLGMDGEFHTGEIRSVQEADRVYQAVIEIRKLLEIDQ